MVKQLALVRRSIQLGRTGPLQGHHVIGVLTTAVREEVLLTHALCVVHRALLEEIQNVGKSPPSCGAKVPKVSSSPSCRSGEFLPKLLDSAVPRERDAARQYNVFSWKIMHTPLNIGAVTVDSFWNHVVIIQ